LLRAEDPQKVWAIVVQLDQTLEDGRLFVLNREDEERCLCLAIRGGRCSKAVEMIITIEERCKPYSAPSQQRMDNQLEFKLHALQE
jgi:hypothetical protein